MRERSRPPWLPTAAGIAAYVAFVVLRVLRLHNWRTLSRLAAGIEPGAESSWVKLASTDMPQLLARLADAGYRPTVN